MKEILANSKTIIFLAKANLKKENKATALGYVWLIISPLITALTLGLIFGIVFGGVEDGLPYLAWQVAGYFPWFFISDAFVAGTFSIVGNKNLVTKLVFPVELLPVIEYVKEFYKFLILMVITTLILASYKIYPTIYWIQLIYCILCSFFFIYGVTKFTSSLVVVFRDLGNFVNAIMQMLFWGSGVVWSINGDKISSASGLILLVLKTNPFFYLVQIFRDTFLSRKWFWESPRDALVFWAITGAFILLGNYVFKKTRDDFADFI
ncbi:teichoic acid translocation permease protein TagG [Erysipelotrichaceae bacterium]|nr:teichoic acid translocation permease protein TagG [Erysipelotrichaceae bacterium]